MRKISLTDGKFSVEILPDCGGAISALRWIAPTGQTFDLLRPARAEDIAGRIADRMSCVPVTSFAASEAGGSAQIDLAEWIVQDASNIRATLTLHKEAGHKKVGKNEALQSSYQLLQRFELGPKGLRIQLTLTNIGVKPMPARTGLRLHPDWRGENILRGALTPVDAAGQARPGSHSPTATDLAAGYPLARQDIEVCLRYQGREIRYEWPEERLALVLSLVEGFDYVGLNYNAGRHEIWLTPLSRLTADGSAFFGTGLLQQGDSLSAILLLSTAALAA